MIWKMGSRSVLILLLLTFGGCFFSDTPVLLPIDGDRFPGGAGKFRARGEDQEKPIYIEVAKRPSFKHEYEMTYVDEDGEANKVNLLFKKVAGELYIVQMFEDQKYILVSAKMTPNSLRFFEFDEDKFEEQLTVAGFKLLKYRLFSDNSEAKQQAKEFRKSGREFAIDEVAGYTLFGDRENILEFASELARIQALSPTSDKTFQRVR